MRAPTCLSLFLLAACKSLPTVPSVATNDPAFERPTVPALSGLTSDVEPEEKILVGDVLGIRTFSVSPLELTDLVVDVAGYLHVPIAGPVLVAGNTVEQAGLLVEEKLHRFDARAQVQLRLVTALGHHATVTGTVAQPGVYAVTPGLRLADLISKAGGPVQQITEGEQVTLADLDGARVLRGGAALPVSITKALEGDLLHNVLVHAGDLLIVPPSRGQRVTILGEVHAAKTIPYRAGLRITDTLAMAGGINAWADGGDIHVVRGPFSHPLVYRASLSAITRGSSADVALEPGDVLLVTETFFGSTTDVLARLAPLLYTFGVARALIP